MLIVNSDGLHVNCSASTRMTVLHVNSGDKEQEEWCSLLGPSDSHVIQQ
jgi:hypothetical protein